jgi:PPOX class probable F420-dependent enzyme
MSTLASLRPAESALLEEARRAVLATIRADGRPRLVPIAYVVDLEKGALFTPLDDKPKSVGDVRRLGRVRDITSRPRVSVLVDRWSEAWAELAWLRLDGVARLVEPASADHGAAVAGLRRRYPQYAGQRLEERPLLRIDIDTARGWAP